MKNVSIGYIFFELNCDFYSQVSYKKDVDPHSSLKSVDWLVIELKELIIVYRENFQYV